MKHLTNFEFFEGKKDEQIAHIKYLDVSESAGEDDNEYELHIRSEVSKLKRGDGAGLIDIGEINKVSNTVIDNLGKTYPGSEVIIKDDHYFLKVK
jgi:hypothetical protein